MREGVYTGVWRREIRYGFARFTFMKRKVSYRSCRAEERREIG
jgi:hypothetical protein